MTKVAQILCLLFPRKRLCIHFGPNPVGPHFGLFSQTHLVTLLELQSATFLRLRLAAAK
jgi:hypothetical protein